MPQYHAGMIGLVLVSLCAATAGAEVLQVANTSVTIDMPAGYKLVAAETGICNEKLSSCFEISEYPASAFDGLQSSMTVEKMLSRGLIKPTAGTLARHDEYIYRTSVRTTPPAPEVHYMLAFRAGNSTVVVSGAVRQTALDSGDLTQSVIEASLASARIVAKKK